MCLFTVTNHGSRAVYKSLKARDATDRNINGRVDVVYKSSRRLGSITYYCDSRSQSLAPTSPTISRKYGRENPYLSRNTRFIGTKHARNSAQAQSINTL